MMRGPHHPVDNHVGRQLRERRVALGMTQEKLSESVGLTFQQVQKYERGANRISASMLYQFAQVLQMPVGDFFAGIDDVEAPRGEPMRREVLEAARAFHAMPDGPVRRHVFSLIKAIAREGHPGEING